MFQVDCGLAIHSSGVDGGAKAFTFIAQDGRAVEVKKACLEMSCADSLKEIVRSSLPSLMFILLNDSRASISGYVDEGGMPLRGHFATLQNQSEDNGEGRQNN